MTIRFGILTLSDRSSRGERADASGPALADLIHAQNWSVAEQLILPDDESAIRSALTEWADSGRFDVMIVELSRNCPGALLRCAAPGVNSQFGS